VPTTIGFCAKSLPSPDTTPEGHVGQGLNELFWLYIIQPKRKHPPSIGSFRRR